MNCICLFSMSKIDLLEWKAVKWMTCNIQILNFWCMLHLHPYISGALSLGIESSIVPDTIPQISSHFVENYSFYRTLHPKINENQMLQCILKFLQVKANYIRPYLRFWYGSFTKLLAISSPSLWPKIIVTTQTVFSYESLKETYTKMSIFCAP